MKQWVHAIQNGVARAFGEWRLGVGLYALTLTFGVVLAWPVRSFLLSHAAHRATLDTMLPRTAYTFMNDLRIAYGKGWIPDLDQFIILGSLFLLLWTFLTGGIIQRLRHDIAQSSFWGACGHYFGRLLKINLVFWLLHIVLLVLFFVLYRSISSGFSPRVLDTESIIFQSIPWVWGSCLLVATVLVIWQSLCHLTCVQVDELPWYRVFGLGWRMLWQRFMAYFGLGLLSIGVLVASYLGYHSLKATISVGEWTGSILVLLVLTQIWVWWRIVLKLAFLAIVIEIKSLNH